MNKRKITWRKPERAIGAYAWLYQQDGIDLCVNKVRVLYIRKDRDRGCWYWYGQNRNTLMEGLRFPSMDDARAHAREFIETNG